MRATLPALLLLPLAGCRDSGSAATAFPRIGLAVSDTARAWCAEFVSDSTHPAIEPGRTVTIVVGTAAVPTLGARVRAPRVHQCPAEFAQPRWIDYAAYDLELADSPPRDVQLPIVALVVASGAPWTRGADSLFRADLDGDGVPEELRRCTADEGEHFTVWSRGSGGARVRRWHEYYDWGAFTDPTCAPGEDGQ